MVVAAAILATADAAASAHGARRPWLDWLHMTNAREGYALGGKDYLHHLLLRTTDGGRSWHDITPGGGKLRPSGPPDIQGSTILFSRSLSKHVFVVERSTDGGRTWTASAPVRNGHGGEPGTPHMVGHEHLYLMLGEGAAAGSEGEALYVSSDSGRHWQLVSQTHINSRPGGLPFGCDKNGFGFATPSRGWATGYCAGGNPFFERTRDGGRRWRQQRLPGAPRSCACDTSTPIFFDRLTGIVAVSGFDNGGAGKPFTRVYWTSDSGNHWRGSTPSAGRTGIVDVVGPKVVWAFGRASGDAPRFSRLFRTTDSGRHWHSLRVPADIGGGRLDAVTARLGFVSSGRRVWQTTDGGRHWTRIEARD